MIGALVLAAGRGDRMGGPKALLAWPGDRGDGEVVPLGWAHALARDDCDRVLVVTRRSIAEVLERHRPPGLERARLVLSDAPDELGPAGSIAAAAHLLGECGSWIVTPVDVPPARASTVARLLEALAPEVMAAKPRHQGRGGHPIVARAELFERCRYQPVVLRELLREHAGRVIGIDVDDPDVLRDIDTPAELGRTPSFCR